MLRYLPETLKEKLRLHAGVATPLSRLRNLKRAGFVPHEIIDAGAYKGDWAKMVRAVFPQARLLLLEPQEDQWIHLSQMCKRWGNGIFCPNGLDSVRRTAKFATGGSNSRIVPDDYIGTPDEKVVKVEVDTLENLASKHDFNRCDFLKLDLQGHELVALSGAGNLFGEIELIQVEVSWIAIGTAPIIDDVIQVFRSKNYRMYDIFCPNYRPKDGALWQTDILFVRCDSPLVQSNAWV